jgi:hypothetical protein
MKRPDAKIEKQKLLAPSLSRLCVYRRNKNEKKELEPDSMKETRT